MPARQSTKTKAAKKPTHAPTPRSAAEAAEVVRKILRGTSFEEEDSTPTAIFFSSREGGDMEEDRADPTLVRFAREIALKIRAALPEAAVRVDSVDEWVSIGVTYVGAATVAEKLSAPVTPVKLAPPPWAKGPPRSLSPGEEVEYTHLTYGAPAKRTAIVGWDHGKRVEAREPNSRTGFTLERGQDGKLYRHGF